MNPIGLKADIISFIQILIVLLIIFICVFYVINTRLAKKYHTSKITWYRVLNDWWWFEYPSNMADIKYRRRKMTDYDKMIYYTILTPIHLILILLFLLLTIQPLNF